MAYGFPVQSPIIAEEPRGVRSANNPGLPEMAELPSLRAAGSDARLPAMPPMTQVPQVREARAREVEQFAAEMGTAFAYSKAQDKAGKQRAKDTERRKTKAAERQGKQETASAKKRNTAMRKANARMALNEARRLSLGPKLYKTAKL